MGLRNDIECTGVDYSTSNDSVQKEILRNQEKIIRLLENNATSNKENEVSQYEVIKKEIGNHSSIKIGGVKYEFNNKDADILIPIIRANAKFYNKYSFYLVSYKEGRVIFI